MMRLILGLSLVLAMFAPAWSQIASKPIVFEELNGRTIEAKVTLAQKVRNPRDNKVRSSNSTRTITLIISGKTIKQSNTNVVTNPDGRTIGSNSRSGQSVVNRPRKSASGDGIWLFDEGRLVWLQAYVSGARRTTIDFKRDAARFACSIDVGLAPEEGAGVVRAKSGIGTDIIEVLEAKMVESSCQVRKTGE